ncbi:MAG TPA: ABC transporter substrate-binding protein [Clostridiales bacterium]|jgi:iron complex transport system substrate-binding protein|nr:ABC transporter substrate-binding protein [Clostridiales bacterium]
MKRIISLFIVLTILFSLGTSSSLATQQVPEDGLYSIGVHSSSKMFRITNCLLQVQQGKMTAILTLSSKNYGYLYPGTVTQADAAPRNSWIPPEDSSQSVYTFRVPISVLDKPVEVAAWSKKYEKWYERQLTFLSGSLRPEEQTPQKSEPLVIDDGRYLVAVHTDSPLLKIEHCVLAVADGKMQAEITIKDSKYGFLYSGLAKDALQADISEHIALLPDDDGKATTVLPISALDEDLPLATWSDKKKLWYNRTIRLDSKSLEPVKTETTASFTFTGGSGRTTISLTNLDETTGLATISFSSSNYTQVKIDESIYLNENPSGDSTFTLPLTVNGQTLISAETVAMSQPRWIDYSLYLFTDGTDATQMMGNSNKPEKTQAPSSTIQQLNIDGLNYLGDMQLEYAHNMAIRMYEGGFRLIQTTNGRNYLLVPQEQTLPDGLPENIILLYQPLDKIYLVASAAMCLIDSIGALPNLRFTGTKIDSWHIPAAKEAMGNGSLLYAGKYSAPDYELLLSGGCDLTVQSTMILHAPEVQEKFKELGIPMFIDMAGLESHPLGRTEWIKVYGVLLGKEEAAQEIFKVQKDIVEALTIDATQAISIAFFYINSNGAVVSKPASDYIPALIRLAGGTYLGPESRTSSTASVTMEMEAFYALARDADCLIYNAAIDTAPKNMTEFLAKSELLSDFKAVKEGRVYAASGALYQSSHRFGDAVKELYDIFTQDSTSTSNSFFQKIPDQEW